MKSFNDILESDHLGMLDSNEFGSVCLNTTTNETFNIIKTDAFVGVDEGGLPVIEDKPMFNTSRKHYNLSGDLIDTTINQWDILTIDSINYIVREVRNDGIGGLDIYLKDGSDV